MLLDTVTIDWSNEDFRGLRTKLIEAYPNITTALTKAEDVGVRRTDLHLDATTGDLWKEIMEKAAAMGKLRSLVTHARDDKGVIGFRDFFDRYLSLPAPAAAAPDAKPRRRNPAVGNPTTALRNFLTEHFEVDEIKRVVRPLYGPALLDSLPLGGSKANFMFELVLAMQRRGYLKDENLYLALLLDRDFLADRVEEIASAQGVDLPPEE